jgi:hypothetical protein
MLRLASIKALALVLLMQFGAQYLQAQSWVPSMNGIYRYQWSYPDYFNVEFKSDLLGKDWIFGTWWDQDSVRRCVGYRSGGEWVSLPISFDPCCLAIAYDIAAHGDTLLITGTFGKPTNDLDTFQNVYASGFMKWWNDSLWFEQRLASVRALSVSNDSILVWGDYLDSTFVRFGHNLSDDGGKTWHYPYNVVHPTEATANFGPFADLEIYNGDVYTLNNGSPGSDSAGWKGIVRWDGTQWHAYPYGMWGGWARSTALAFYQNELYMGGTFFQADHPNNPGNGIAKWDGTQWTSMGGGVGGFVIDLFLHDSLLYTFISNSGFADAPISYFAAWNGHQWCGTPANFARPPISFGFANDTLFCTFNEQSTTIDGDTVTYMNYFVGDYVNGPNAVCSTYDLGTEDQRYIEQRLIISPNPFSTSAVIELGDDNYDVTIMDITGRIVRQMSGATGNIVFERGNMKAGIYMMTVVNTKGEARTSKFVVE